MVESRVDEHAGVVPRARLDANGLVDKSVLSEVLVRDRDGYRGDKLRVIYANFTGLTVLAEQCNERPIRTPDNILHWRRCDFCKRFLLLDIVEHDRRGRRKDQARCTAVEDLVRLHGRLDALHYRV